MLNNHCARTFAALNAANREDVSRTETLFICSNEHSFFLSCLDLMSFVSTMRRFCLACKSERSNGAWKKKYYNPIFVLSLSTHYIFIINFCLQGIWLNQMPLNRSIEDIQIPLFDEEAAFESNPPNNSINAPDSTSLIMSRSKPVCRIESSIRYRSSIPVSLSLSRKSEAVRALTPPYAQQRAQANNVSPVPSIITSECSDGTVNSSMVRYSTYNNENEEVDIFNNNVNTSLANTAFSDQHYFTPLQGRHLDTNASVFLPGKPYHEPKLPSAHFPQCTTTPDSRMSSEFERGQHVLTHHRMSPNFVTHQSYEAYTNVQAGYGAPFYCRPTNDINKPFSLQETQGKPIGLRHEENETLYGRPVLRKISVDSLDSTLSFQASYESNTDAIPLPQNLKGDPHRQAKVKTELCLNYAQGKECPFGSRCNYAHGENQLKYKKLIELKEAGLVEDVTIYRSRPCFSWVATGAW